ncbi:hypothetical protein NWT09_31395 [Mycolicibacterium sp. jd]|uniref:hypothetical protein n=1 Tax=unclassified Mycolicibacterium TaxID=2636767 RepID=UPI00351AFA46
MAKITGQAAQTRPAEDGNGYIVRIALSEPGDAQYQKQLSDIFNAKTYGIHEITADYVEVRVDRESQAGSAEAAVHHTIDVANGDAALD